jgi:hypothetical protein
MSLPSLPEPLAPTRDALHGFAKVLGAVVRQRAVPRPHWWHLGLVVRPDGLATVPVPLPGGGAMAIRLDPVAAAVEARSSRGESSTVDLREISPVDLAAEMARFVARCGLGPELDRSRVPEGAVDPDWDVAASYMGVLVDLAEVLERRRSDLGVAAGPLVVWPHGFDLAFEWFGTRQVAGDDGTAAPAQLNLGFSPYDGGYLYSNPWPFDAALTEEPLPAGASWHLDDWQGTILPYAAVAGRDDGVERLLSYAEAVHRIARPTLDIQE